MLLDFQGLEDNETDCFKEKELEEEENDQFGAGSDSQWIDNETVLEVVPSNVLETRPIAEPTFV